MMDRRICITLNQCETMNKIKITSAIVLVALLSHSGFASADEWSGFLGPGGASVASAVLPKALDDETNVAWKKQLPGKGASSPIVIGKNIVVTCSGGIGDKQDAIMVLCFDKESGEQRWRQDFWATGRTLCHGLSANAAPTPATDGERIFAFFSSNDMACLDLEGNLIWYRGLAVDHPKAGNDVGMSSSPVVADGVVVAQVECQGDSFAIGLDAKTGETKWTQERARKAVWASPTVITPRDGKKLVLIQSADKIDVLDPVTGEIKFEKTGQVSTISTACVVDDTIYAPIDGTSTFSVSSKGEVTPKWNAGKIRAGSPSYQVNEDTIFTCNSKGIVRSFNRETGEMIKQARVGGSYWATPVVADGHMYLFGDNGELRIANLHLDDDSKNPEVVHKYKFETVVDGEKSIEVFLGSPAVSGNALFVRSDRYLWKFAE
jgi:outer membrane protein assembly factor BamB